MILVTELTRFKYGRNETVGLLTLPWKDDSFWAIENPWLDNKPNFSCIPEGLYYLERYDSPAHGEGTWQFIDVPDRTHCQIHVANYAKDVSGCIGLGMQVMSDLGGVGRSADAMSSFRGVAAEYASIRMTIKSGAVK